MVKSRSSSPYNPIYIYISLEQTPPFWCFFLLDLAQGKASRWPSASLDVASTSPVVGKPRTRDEPDVFWGTVLLGWVAWIEETMARHELCFCPGLALKDEEVEEVRSLGERNEVMRSPLGPSQDNPGDSHVTSWLFCASAIFCQVANRVRKARPLMKPCWMWMTSSRAIMEVDQMQKEDGELLCTPRGSVSP